MNSKFTVGDLDLLHILVVIAIVSIAVAILVPLHGNISIILNSIMGENNQTTPSNILVTVQGENNTSLYTITIKNNENTDIVIDGILINGYECYFTSGIVIPPNGIATLTININPLNLVSINGAYTTGVVQLTPTCYASNQPLNNGFGVIANGTAVYTQ